MRTIVAAAAAFALLAPAQAQYDQFASVSSTARDIYANCLTIAQHEGAVDARAACACITGYMGGMMSDRDFEAASILLRIGELAESGASQGALEAEVAAFFARGFTEDDANRVSTMVESAGARGDAVCAQFQANPSV